VQALANRLREYPIAGRGIVAEGRSERRDADLGSLRPQCLRHIDDARSRRLTGQLLHEARMRQSWFQGVFHRRDHDHHQLLVPLLGLRPNPGEDLQGQRGGTRRMVWSSELRGKFVVEKALVDQLAIDGARRGIAVGERQRRPKGSEVEVVLVVLPDRLAGHRRGRS